MVVMFRHRRGGFPEVVCVGFIFHCGGCGWPAWLADWRVGRLTDGWLAGWLPRWVTICGLAGLLDGSLAGWLVLAQLLTGWIPLDPCRPRSEALSHG